MQSTITAQETDPHDIFVIEPDVVLAARADKPPANPAQDASGRASAPKVHPLIAEVSGITTTSSVPPVDTRFRATAVDAPAVESSKIVGQIPNQVSDQFTAAKPSRGRWAARSLMGFLFAICSAMAAAAWQHYGDTAKQKMAAWVPTFFQASSTPEKAAAAEPPAATAAQDTASDQTAVAGQAGPQPQSAAPAQTADGATAPAAGNTAESAQTQAMARDMATMGQQIEQLKASIEQLKASQEKMSQQMSRDLVKNTVARLSEPNPRARIAPPPRPAHKPRAVYTPVQATPAPLPPPQAVIAPAPMPPAPPAQATSDSVGDPVVRPPMPLR